MPATRPAEISDCVSLEDKLATAVPRFVAEHGAIDALLPTGVLESAPHKHGVSFSGSEDDFLAGTAEQNADSSIAVSVGRVMFFIERKAVRIAVFCQMPQRDQ